MTAGVNIDFNSVHRFSFLLLLLLFDVLEPLIYRARRNGAEGAPGEINALIIGR